MYNILSVRIRKIVVYIFKTEHHKLFCIHDDFTVYDGYSHRVV